MSDVQVTNNSEKSQYEARIGDDLAGVAQYELQGEDTIVFTHTIVEPEHEGQGVGSALARTALDEVRGQGDRKVVPQCSFIAGWISKHPDYQELVDQAQRPTD